MSYVKQPRIKGHIACGTCGCGPKDSLSKDRILSVGFGETTVTKDGDVVYSETKASVNEEVYHDEAYWTVADAEQYMSLFPNGEHDWRIVFITPLYGATYQWQEEDGWVLIDKNNGFA